MSDEKKSLIGRGGNLASDSEKRRSYGTQSDPVTFEGSGSGMYGEMNGKGEDVHGFGPSYHTDASGQILPASGDQDRVPTYQEKILKEQLMAGTGQPGFYASGRILTPDGISQCAFADPPEGLDKSARNRLFIASMLCMVFMVGEIVGGTFSNSLAVISDGVHLLTDFASFLIAMSALYLAQRPASNKLNFGWHRIEILGACLSILLLWILTGILCYSAVLRIIHNDFEIEPKILLITASIGVFFNIVLATVLNEDMDLMLGWGNKDDASEDHETGSVAGSLSGSLGKSTRSSSDGLSVSHEKSAIDKTKVRQKPGNINVKAAFIHVLGDLVQSVGILSSALVIYFKPEWKIADPCCTFFFSFMVILTTMTIMRDILTVLMEAAPRDVDVPGMKTDLLNVRGVVGLHNYRVWSLTLDKIAVSAHLNVAASADPCKVLEEATFVVRDLYYAHEAYIQLERGLVEHTSQD